jgi:hypothetical protein
MPEGESAPGAISEVGDETMMPSGLRFCRVFGQPQGLRGEPQKNVLVPRFFLTFSSLDVPYISRGSGRHFLLVHDWPRVTVEFFSYFSRFRCSLARGRVSVSGTKYLFLTFAFLQGSLVVGGSTVSKFFNVSLLWEGEACMKDTDHCVRHRDVHQSNCASVRNEKKLSIAERSIWTRPGTVLGWGDPTFAHGSVAKVIRGSLQPKCSVRSVPRGEGEGETLTSSQRR